MPNKYEIITRPNEGKKYEISIWDNIENYEDYDKLFETLDKISSKDSVTLNVSSPGGRRDIGFEMIDRIKELPCRVDVIVSYKACSMGALIALSGHSLEIKGKSYIMFHDFSTGRSGKGNEIFKGIEACKEVFEERFNEICQPFLTKKECEHILNGRDLYVKWNDNNLKKRIKRHYG